MGIIWHSRQTNVFLTAGREYILMQGLAPLSTLWTVHSCRQAAPIWACLFPMAMYCTAKKCLLLTWKHFGSCYFSMSSLLGQGFVWDCFECNNGPGKASFESFLCMKRWNYSVLWNWNWKWNELVVKAALIPRKWQWNIQKHLHKFFSGRLYLSDSTLAVNERKAKVVRYPTMALSKFH